MVVLFRATAGPGTSADAATNIFSPGTRVANTLAPMKIPGLRSAHEQVGGIVYFGRMLDKIRLHAQGRLPADYNIGTKSYNDFDSRCTRLLKVPFRALQKRAIQGGADLTILRWCFKTGRKPRKEEIEIWNTFMTKRGWRDSSTPGLDADKRTAGLARRADLATWFDVFDADES